MSDHPENCSCVPCDYARLRSRLTALEAELAAEKATMAKLRKAAASAIADFDALVGDSGGVYGLHRNGDNSPWCELTAGGPFEEWTAGIETLRRIHEETA